MIDEGDGREPHAPKDSSRQDSGRDARQDRLKLALRENLKRRKSQARGRDDLAAESSNAGKAAPYDDGGNPESE